MSKSVGGVLGTGDYRVQIQRKPATGIDGTTQVANLGTIKTIRIFWSRVLDETSEASVEVPVTGVGTERCCEILQQVVPISHELVIYRNNQVVWVGPILRIIFRGETARIEARDLSWWLNHLLPRIERQYVQTDLSTMFKDLIEEALSINNFHMLYSVNPSGILGTRNIKVNEYIYIGDTLRELGRTGIDWTVFGRKLYAGGYTVPNATPIVGLRTEHFKSGYEVVLSGDKMCSNAVVKGDGDVSTAEYGPGEDSRFGHIDAVWPETTIKDYNSAFQAAKTRYEMLNKPSIYFRNPKKLETGLAADELSATDTGILIPSAPVDIQKLIPGAAVNLSVDYLCQTQQFSVRLKRISVTVENNENVELGFIPVGTSNEDI